MTSLSKMFAGLASILKDADAGDVHVATALGNEGKRKKKPKAGLGADTKEVTVDLAADIVKADEEARVVYGWASVISEKGQPVVDTQGDIISPAELVKATTDFMADARIAKAMHEGGQIGEVLHSFPLTAEFAKALGIESDREGWIVGLKIHDDGVWKQVKDGKLKAFSIGGAAMREPIAA